MITLRVDYKGESIHTRPTQAMKANAIKGLELRKEHGRGGTLVGVRRANQIKNREYLSPETVRRRRRGLFLVKKIGRGDESNR